MTHKFIAYTVWIILSLALLIIGLISEDSKDVDKNHAKTEEINGYTKIVAEEIGKLSDDGLCEYFDCNKVDRLFSSMVNIFKEHDAILKLDSIPLGKIRLGYTYSFAKIRGGFLVINVKPIIGHTYWFELPLDKRMVAIVLLDSTRNIAAKKVTSWENFITFLKGKVHERYITDYINWLRNLTEEK